MTLDTQKSTKFILFLILYPIILGLVLFILVLIYTKLTDSNFGIILNQTSRKSEKNSCYTISSNIELSPKYQKVFCKSNNNNPIIKIYE